jgi:hypothetical protein
VRRLVLPALAIFALLSSPAVLARSIVAVRPSGPTVPANLLRVSVVFSSAPSDVGVKDFTLRQANGAQILAPFDPLELWSPDGRVLTILFQPGRVKTGLISHDTLGWAIVPGEDVVLMFRGHAIGSWYVVAAINTAPDPTHWRVKVPRPGTKEPATLKLSVPIDALDKDLVAVADSLGHRVPGFAALARGETVWDFVPSRPWRPGFYSVKINPDLEDPAGNRVGQSFQHRPATNAKLEVSNLKILIH